jgi:excisionase family DNA binding protein
MLLDYETVAQLFDVSIKTIQRYVKAGHLETVNTGKKGVRITSSSVNAFAKKNLIPHEAVLDNL